MTLLYLSSLSALPLIVTLPVTVPYDALPAKADINDVLPTAEHLLVKKMAFDKGGQTHCMHPEALCHRCRPEVHTHMRE